MAALVAASNIIAGTVAGTAPRMAVIVVVSTAAAALAAVAIDSHVMIIVIDITTMNIIGCGVQHMYLHMQHGIRHIGIGVEEARRASKRHIEAVSTGRTLPFSYL